MQNNIDDLWLENALTEAIKAVKARDKKTTLDECRKAVKTQLEDLVNQPLPECLAATFIALKDKGYHVQDEILFPVSDQKNPLAVGMTSERFVQGKDPISWRCIRRRLSVWPEPHKINSRGKHLILSLEIVPLDTESVTYSVTVDGQSIETHDPDTHITQIRSLVAENIKANGLLPGCN